MIYRCPKCGMTFESPGRCPRDEEWLENPIQRLISRHGNLMFTVAGLLFIAGLIIWAAVHPAEKPKTWCEENPTSVLCAGGQFQLPPREYFEEELGSQGEGYYTYQFPNWGECVQSGGYVVSRGTSGDDPVMCRFYYSGL